MTSYTLQVQPRRSYTIEYSNQRGPQGPAGADGPATTDASLLVSGTLSDARLSANVLLASSIGVSVQAWDADLDAIAALATTATGRALLTESVAQTGTGALVRAAGPTITGTTSVANLTASGTIQVPSPGKVEVLSASSGTVYMQAGDFQYNNHTLNQRKLMMGNNAAGLIMDSTSMSIRWSASTDVFSSPRTGISENGAGVVSIDTTTRNNGLGSLNLTNLTASGTVTGNTLTASALGFAIVASSGGVQAHQDSGLFVGTRGYVAATSGNELRLCGTGGVRLMDYAQSGLVGLTCSNLTASGTLDVTGNIVGTGTTRIRLGTGSNPALRVNGQHLQVCRVDTEADGPITASLFKVSNAGGFVASSSIDPTTTLDTSLSRNAAGVWQMGTTANNALGSLLLTNLTASGTVRLGTFTVGTLPSAAANTRARAFVTDSNLAFNSTNLGSTVTAGGAILVPVFSDGTNWVIG